MDLGMRECPRYDCNGTVSLHADGLNELVESTGYGQCDTCGQHYEVELYIEASEELIAIDDAEMQARGKL